MCRVTMGHLRVTIGHLRVTIGRPRVTIGDLRATMGHLRLTIGSLAASPLNHRDIQLVAHLLSSQHTGSFTAQHYLKSIIFQVSNGHRP